MYTFEPLPGVLCGGRVLRGAWGAAKERCSFQEEMRLKRKRDAKIVQEMMPYMSSGVILCGPREFEEVPDPEVEEVATPVRVVPPIVYPSGPLLADYRLPFQRFRPEKLEHYVGNRDSRDAAAIWLKLWTTTLALQKPRKTVEAMLLLYGHVGAGKSTWARYVALQGGFSIATYSPGDGGGHDVQKLDFWLRSQPSRNLRGQPMAVVLDDVDELFRVCPAAMSIKVNCPIIATAGPAPDAALRRKCSKAIHFAKLQPYDASKVVLRLMPNAGEGAVKTIVQQANGDIRQLMIRSSLGLWNVAGVTDEGGTSFGRAQGALHGEAPLDEDCEDDRHSYRIMHHNFHKCCPDDGFLRTYAGFLGDVSALDAMSAMHLTPFAVRRWRGMRSGWRLDALPISDKSKEDCDVEASVRSSAGDPEETMGAYARNRDWVSRRPTFKPGLQFACSLLMGKLGTGLASEAAKEHYCGELLEEACLSTSLRITAQHVVEIAGYFEDFAG